MYQSHDSCNNTVHSESLVENSLGTEKAAEYQNTGLKNFTSLDKNHGTRFEVPTAMNFHMIVFCGDDTT